MAFHDYYLWAALCLLFVELIHFIYQPKLDDDRSKMFLLIIFIAILHCVCGITITFFLTQNAAAHPLNLIATTVLYICQVSLPYSMFCLICLTLPHKNNILLRIASIPLGVGAVVALLNPFTGLLAYAGADGFWHVGKGYPCFIYGLMIWYGCNILLTLFYRKQLRNRFLPLVEISLLLLTGMVFQHILRIQLFVGFTAALAITVLHLTLQSSASYQDFTAGVFNVDYFQYWIAEQFQKRPDTNVILLDFFALERIYNTHAVHIFRTLISDIAENLWQITPHHRVFRLSFSRFVLCTCSKEEAAALRVQLEQFCTDSYRIEESNVSCPALIYDVGSLQKLPNVQTLSSFMDFLLFHTGQPDETCFHKVNEDTYQQFFYEQDVEQFLLDAVQNDLFEVWFQPIYSVSQQSFTTLEALSRLKHPKYGWISPELFINQIACKNNLIFQLMPLQLKKICLFLQQNPVVMQQIHTIKVNLTPNELLKPDYCDQLIHIIRSSGVPSSCFQFEITETSATRHTKEVMQCIQKFTSAGIGLCLDDFGSGYANLSNILRLPFSVIKMDRSLLYHICEDETSRTFYHNMVVTLKAMGYQVVAEGIETKEEADYMLQWHVDLIQGYYYSPPLSARKTLALFSKEEETLCESH